MDATRARMHFRVCMTNALQAAQMVHYASTSGQRDEMLTKAMHSLLIIAEECRQALAMPAKENTDE